MPRPWRKRRPWIVAAALRGLRGAACGQGWLVPMTSEQFDAWVREEIAAHAALVKAAGIKAN